jgi:hypothetical protein
VLDEQIQCGALEQEDGQFDQKALGALKAGFRLFPTIIRL